MDAANITSLAGWPDGGVSGILSYPLKAEGPGLTLTSTAGSAVNATTLVKWNSDGTVGWSLTPPPGATFGEARLLSTGRLLASVHATASLTFGSLQLDATTVPDGVVQVDSTGLASGGVSTPFQVDAIAALTAGDFVVSGWAGCADESSCATRGLAGFHGGAKSWVTPFGAVKNSFNLYGATWDMTLGNDGLVYVAFAGPAQLANQSPYQYMSLGAQNYFGFIAAVAP